MRATTTSKPAPSRPTVPVVVGARRRDATAKLLAVLVLILALTGCVRGAGEGAAAGLEFAEVAAASGLEYEGPTYCPAVADYDADGWPDVAISNHGHLRLYRNRGDGTFGDESAAGDFTLGDTHGLSWLDLDGDGRLDLYVSIGARRGRGRAGDDSGRRRLVFVINGPNRLHRNLGGGKFALTEGLPEVLEDPSGRGRCSAPYDFDGDGRLDLMIMNAPQRGRENRLALNLPSGFEDAAAASGLAAIRAACITVTRFGPDHRPLWVTYGGGADSGRLLRWTPAGLQDVTAELGVDVRGQSVQAVAVGDYDADGDLDLYFVHGHGIIDEATQREQGIDFRFWAKPPQPVKGFRFRADEPFELDFVVGNNRRPELVRLGRESAPVEALPSSIDPAADELSADLELDATSEPGLYLWREGDGRLILAAVIDPEVLPAVLGRLRGSGIELVAPLQRLPKPPATPNSLWQNRGDRFVEVTAEAGVGDPHTGRDALFADLDNDGDLDLFVINGGRAFENLPDVLYRNRGDGSFEEITAAAGARGPRSGRGACAVAFDFDRDGDLDLLVTNGDGPPLGNEGPYTLLENRSASGNWAELELRGSGSNPFAFGALVTARFGDRTMMFHRTATTGRFATSVLPIHLGLGTSPDAAIEVEWASGGRKQAEIRAGQRLVLAEEEEAIGSGP